ncbi:hypothetical protein K435DRAFT_855628 [Dendrothele bispora CBS 962.96]|uniref:Uncharacterized protein n=1 Tax=Dendrothele bispora (strain CBS 962.96) TaxID=1314807 RepID=A0A4S8MC33_DENBC|nr:hypothetical protein K435DRAFT_855628 [Dendrothele bispora CBS 962.96]
MSAIEELLSLQRGYDWLRPKALQFTKLSYKWRKTSKLSTLPFSNPQISATCHLSWKQSLAIGTVYPHIGYSLFLCSPFCEAILIWYYPRRRKSQVSGPDRWNSGTLEETFIYLFYRMQECRYLNGMFDRVSKHAAGFAYRGSKKAHGADYSDLGSNAHARGLQCWWSRMLLALDLERIGDFYVACPCISASLLL